MLSAVIKLHLERTLNLIDSRTSEYSREVVETLLKSFYVGNCMTSIDSFSELNQFVEQATSVMKKAKFCLRCWEHTEVQSINPILN